MAFYQRWVSLQKKEKTYTPKKQHFISNQCLYRKKKKHTPRNNILSAVSISTE